MLKRGLVSCAVLGFASSAFAGLALELRPDTSTFSNGTPFGVDVYIVETPAGTEPARGLRGVQLDFSDTTGINAQVDNPFFDWDYTDNIGLGSEFFTYPRTTWIWPIGTPNTFMIELPDTGANDEAKVGDFHATPTGDVWTLDIVNPDEPDVNQGAFLTYGFGGPTDPVTNLRFGQGLTYQWRLPNGSTGQGALVVPEPTTLGLLAVGALAAIRRRRTA